MGESHENLLKAVKHCQESLDKYTENRNDSKLLHYLERLYKLPIKVMHLEQTGVGRTVNGLRKLGGDVGDSAKSLVAKWKQMVVGEQEEEDEDEDEEDEDEEEDGYQSGEEPSNDSDDKDSRDAKTKTETSSSHRKSDNYRTDDRERISKSKHSSSKSDSNHSSDSSKYSKKDKHNKHNGHSKHKSNKRKVDESSSEDESPKKRPKSSDDEDRYKPRKKLESDSEDDYKVKEKKQKTEKLKSEHRARKMQDSSSDFEDAQKSSRPKEKHRDSKDKHKSSRKDDLKREDARKHEHAKKTKEKDKKSRDSAGKAKKEEKSENKKAKSSTKAANGSMTNTGIDSGSGASFAEALGMLCEPSSSKNSSKKKAPSSEKKEKPATKTDDPIPKLLKEPNLLLKEPTLEPIDLNISSLLPTITPNYRPLGSFINSDAQARKWLSESEALTQSITSKNQRTKVYSGNKMGGGKVASLFELCIRVLQDNIDALEYTGGVPYSVLKPILEKSNPNQLYMMEHHNPYLIEDTDELWQLHCQKDFRNKKREELETWREMYLRCLDERDAKLKALTANIKQSQDKSLPVRMTKLAYVDAVAKPPRNIARKQAKNGTASVERKPSMTPSARVTLLATAGDAGKVAVPNPGSRAVERSSHQATKPKKAPLMLKSISSFKNRFKR